MNDSDLLGDFTVSGVKWECVNNSHQNAMWYRYLTTDEINSFGYNLDVSDDAPVGEDEVGFFNWNEEFDRPVVVIELVQKSDEYEVIASRTSFGPNRAGAAEPLGGEFTEPVLSIEKANSKIKEFARKLSTI